LERIGKRPADVLLLAVLALIVSLGLPILFSASHYYAERIFNDPYYMLKRQIAWVLIGSMACFFAARAPLELLRRLTPFLLAIALALSLAVFIPGIGQPLLGSRRWIFVAGLSFEPSELAKLALVLYLASILAKKQERINDPLNSIVPPLLVVLAFAAIVYFQKDFSTAVFLLAIALCMFLIAQVRLLYVILLSLLFLPLGGMLLFTQAYRVERLMAFFNPLADPTGSGYQAIAARSALVSGGLWGSGLGRGLKSLGGLPEAHSDFVFAVIGEETGFLGALFMLLLFVLFAWRGYAIALGAEDDYSSYLAFGLTTTIFLQALLNIAVVAGLVPATGVPLPLVSAGGSCMVATLAMSGLLLNLSRQVKGEG
jgi:cell division protein FtsW